ncbi:MAG: branched-chain amino acid ABC transporter substrate-binding protein [Anaerolineae bacterium]|nr:branched-chain amino acid ABC transporter substrate-binding protein [Anaerolineae bacterium]
MKLNRFRFLGRGLAGLALAGLLLPFNTTHSQPAPGVVVPPGESLQLGLAVSLSGETLPEAGTDVLYAVNLALETVNAAGGVRGFPLSLVIEDDQCAPAQASLAADVLVQQPYLVAVIGHLCSGPTLAALPTYQAVGIPVISPSATAAALSQVEGNLFSRTILSDTQQGVVAARYIAEVLGVQQIALAHDGGSYGAGLAEIVATTLTEDLGGGLLTTLVLDPADTDYADDLAPLALSGNAPELIYFGGYSDEASLLLEALRTLQLDETILFSGDGIKNDAFLERLGALSEGSYATLAAPDEAMDARIAEFDTRYEAAYGVAPSILGPYHTNAYDAVGIVLAALNQVAEVNAEGALVIDRAELAAAIRATENYNGLSGILTCDAVGDCGSGSIQVFQVIEGVFVQLELPEDLLRPATPEAAGD